MTNDMFWELYDSGRISVKIWDGVVDEVRKSIEAFEFNDKFYLRIHTEYEYVLDRRAECGKRYRMCKENHFFKEFDNRKSANAYFKKAAQGLRRVV